MADVEKVKQGLRYCSESVEWNCDKKCVYGENGKKEAGACWIDLNRDALSVIEELQAENERFAKPAEGTWIQKADATGHEYSMCSACETVINTPDEYGGYYKLDMTGAKYCPNCGAKMD